jgi:hypothetical protein
MLVPFLPDRHGAIVILPRDVDVTVVVEITGALDVCAAPYYRAAEPLSFCQSTPVLPSPKRSPLPTAEQHVDFTRSV